MSNAACLTTTGESASSSCQSHCCAHSSTLFTSLVLTVVLLIVVQLPLSGLLNTQACLSFLLGRSLCFYCVVTFTHHHTDQVCSPGGYGRWGRDRYGPPIRTDYRLIVENLSSRCSWQDLKVTTLTFDL
ncbi:hypothetical protein INR49_019065 [Caranx melampygus]|nr:hypothetical protein INR49_019065 [Caranx melampygus]